MSKLLSKKILLKNLALGLLLSIAPVRAATNIIDFNSDPTGTDLYEGFGTLITGGTAWRPTGGSSGGANDGYLGITDAAGSQPAALVFKDFENSLIIASFTFDCDLRIGGGTSPAADGFSVSLASSTDPVVVAADAGNDPTSAFAGIGTETGLPEEGTTTGLSIGFDQWQSGTEDPQDVAGISVRVDGTLIAQFPIPLGAGGSNVYYSGQPVPGNQGTLYTYDNSGTYANLATNDPNYALSLQTGARNTTDDLNGDGTVDASDPNTPQPAYGDPNYDLWLKNLKWEHFHMEITPDAHVKISWKDRELTPPGGFVTSFAPRAGRIVFAGRTGGSWAAMQVDNIKLVTQPFTSVAPVAFSGNAGGFTLQLQDQGTVSLDPTSLTLTNNGVALTTGITTTKIGNISYVHYSTATLFSIGSTNVVGFGYKDNTGFASTGSRSYTVANYASIPASYATAAGAVDTTSSGFSARVTQIPIDRGPGDANTIANAERQLENGFIDPATGLPYVNLVPAGTNSDGTYPVPVINWNIYPTAAADEIGADIGNFRDTNAPPADVADLPVPGVPVGADVGDPTATGYNHNIAIETTAYLDLAAGYYTFGVNSDDGFQVSTAPGAKSVAGLVLGSFSGGRGSSDTLFDIYVPVSGIFPVRLTWWQGGGGANCEFFYVDQTTGTKRLINDRRDATAEIKAYSTATVTRPYVSRIKPENGQTFVFADSDVAVDVTDGTEAIDSNSLQVSLNGTSLGNPTKTGNVTTVSRAGSVSNLLLPGQNTLSISYSFTEGGAAVTVTRTNTFSVVPYAIIPAANAVTSGQVDQNTAGFKATVVQIDRTGNANQGDGGRLPSGDENLMPRPEIELAMGNINPTNGLPYENIADLSAVNEAPNTFDVADVINWNSSGNSGIFNGGLNLQTVNSPADTTLPGLPGAGTSNGGLDNSVHEIRTYLNLKAGAYVMAFNSDDGFIAISGADPHDTLGTLLGYANVGRGNNNPLPTPGGPSSYVPTPGAAQNNVAFGVVVPQDGIYPFRVLYWEGGGGVNAEFLSVDKGSGLQALVNDVSVPWAIKAYQNYTGPARPWVKFSVSPTPWDNRVQQAGPGPINVVGGTVSSTTAGDIANDSDTRRPWADIPVGAVIANGTSGTIGLVLDGTPVTPTFATNGTDVTVSYRPNPPLASGSSHTAGLVYGGATNWWSFTVQSYTNLNAGDAIPASSADTSAPGFRVKISQVASVPSGFSQNTVAFAEAELAGTVGVPNVANPGPSDGGTYLYPGIINWNNNLNPNHSGSQIGNFQTNVYGPGWLTGNHPDEAIPGIPGTGVANDYTDNIAAEVFAYLNFPAAGYYRFGVNSDDGFKMQVGTPGQTNGTIIASFDVGKGSSDIPFSVIVPQAGLYPIRLVYYNGGGGANLEYFSYDNSGNKVAINDTNNAASIKAYYKLGTTSTGPHLTFSVSGNTLTITWTGGGELQSSSDVANGPWAGTGNTTGTATITIPSTADTKFYRVKQ